MANLWRRFPSDDLECDLPEWGGVNLDGQTFVKRATGDVAPTVVNTFWEAPAGGADAIVAVTGSGAAASTGSVTITGDALTVVTGTGTTSVSGSVTIIAGAVLTATGISTTAIKSERVLNVGRIKKTNGIRV